MGSVAALTMTDVLLKACFYGALGMKQNCLVRSHLGCRQALPSYGPGIMVNPKKSLGSVSKIDVQAQDGSA
jgi:hypothetical protein